MQIGLSAFLTVWAFLALNIASPGPNVLNTIATAMGAGRRAGMGSAAGVGFGIGLWCLFMSQGMAALFRALPALRVVLTVLAVGLLCTFAARYLRQAWAGWQAGHTSAPARATGAMSFAQGFRRSLMVNALNPKALTSWIAVLSLFPVHEAGAADIALLCAGACALAFGLHAGYVLLFSTPLAARAYLRHAWALSGAAGLFFAIFAARLALSLLPPG